MKKLLALSVVAVTLLNSTTFAGSGDSGVPVSDGLINGADAQAQLMKEMGPFAIFLLPLTPLFLAGGVVVDTGEKLTGN